VRTVAALVLLVLCLAAGGPVRAGEDPEVARAHLVGARAAVGRAFQELAAACRAGVEGLDCETVLSDLRWVAGRIERVLHPDAGVGGEAYHVTIDTDALAAGVGTVVDAPERR